MIDSNAKAPKKRSGDDINPVLASIIKITAAVVVVALIVVITLVTIELINRGKTTKDIFEDHHAISVEDFQIIVEGGDYTDISDEDIRKIVMKLADNDDIYFYFYRESLKKDITKTHKEAIEKIAEDAPIFFVDLELSYVTDDSGNVTSKPFETYLKSNEALQELSINAVLREKDSKPVYPTFIIRFNLEEFDNKETLENPNSYFVITYKSEDAILTILKNMPQVKEEE